MRIAGVYRTWGWLVPVPEEKGPLPERIFKEREPRRVEPQVRPLLNLERRGRDAYRQQQELGHRCLNTPAKE